jgi:hypothetical protein
MKQELAMVAHAAKAFRSSLILVLELSRYFQLLGLENCKTRKVGLAN